MTRDGRPQARSTSSGRSRAGSRRIRLDRPERKNPLTFDTYAELRDTVPRPRLCRRRRRGGVRCRTAAISAPAATCTRSSARWSSMDMKELLAFTRMTGDLVKAMRDCRKPIIAAVDGVCVGAGAIIAMASDLRLGTPRGEDRLPVHPRRPRRLRHGRLRDPAAHHRPGPRRRAALHRPHDDGRGRRALGLLQPAGRRRRRSTPRRWTLARALADGPTFAHGMTKTQLNQEWSMGLDQAIEAEAQAQAICMQTQDFERAYQAFVAKAEAGVRGQLMADRELPRLAVLRAPPPRRSPSGSTPGRRTTSPRRPRRRRRRLPRAGGDARPRRLAAADCAIDPAEPGAARRAHALPDRARRSPATTGSPTSPSPCRGSAPARSRLFGTRRAAGRWLPRDARRRRDRRLRAVRAALRLRRRRHRP